jgi:AcrR family transcriptional regulator
MSVSEDQLSPGRLKARRRKTELMLAQAMRIVVADGVGALTLARLAKDLDRTMSSMYRYFDSREELLAQLQVRAAMKVNEAISTALKLANEFADQKELGAPARCVYQLLVIAETYLDIAFDNPADFRLVSLSVGDPAPLSERMNPHGARALHGMVSLYSTILGNAQTMGLLSVDKDPKESTLIFWAHMHSVIPLHKLSTVEGIFDARKLAPQSVEISLLGLGLPAHLFAPAKDLLAQWKMHRAEG